jgi:hypothetical protein
MRSTFLRLAYHKKSPNYTIGLFDFAHAGHFTPELPVRNLPVAGLKLHQTWLLGQKTKNGSCNESLTE